MFFLEQINTELVTVNNPQKLALHVKALLHKRIIIFKSKKSYLHILKIIIPIYMFQQNIQIFYMHE